MLKKIILLFIVFLLCLITGYCTYESPLISNRLSPPKPTPTAELMQNNYLVIHVDDISKAAPDLLSVWAIFASFPDKAAPGVIVKPLYPNPDPSQSPVDWKNKFELSSQKELAQDFQKEINRAYQITWNSTIVLDHYAVMVLSNFLTGIPANPSPTLPYTQDTASMQLQEEQMIWNGICQSLGDQTLREKADFDLQLLRPDHFLMTNSWDDAKQDWADLTGEGRAPICEVLEQAD